MAHWVLKSFLPCSISAGEVGEPPADFCPLAFFAGTCGSRSAPVTRHKPVASSAFSLCRRSCMGIFPREAIRRSVNRQPEKAIQQAVTAHSLFSPPDFPAGPHWFDTCASLCYQRKNHEPRQARPGVGAVEGSLSGADGGRLRPRCGALREIDCCPTHGRSAYISWLEVPLPGQ